MKLMKLFTILACCTLATLSSVAQTKNKLTIRSTSEVYAPQKGDDPTISCFIDGSLIKKGKTKPEGFMFFASNDLRSLPMNLTKSGKSIPPGMRGAKANSYVIFTAPASQLFFTDASKSPYKWAWRGRAKPPVSPIADAGGEKVKTVNCWFTVQIDKRTYTSDTLHLAIQQ
jgi:hypothetical protein